MKILVVCFSLTGKTELIAKKLAKSLGADYAPLRPVKWKSRFAAYTVGLLLAQRRKAVELLPLEDVDVDSYDCIVVSGPIWGGAPAPMLNGFIRQYQLEGKQAYGLLSCGMEGKSASKFLREELEAAGTRCRSVITVMAEEETLEALEKGKIECLMNEKGKIILQVSEKHRKKKNLSENQVQEMRDLIEASETDDTAKKKASVTVQEPSSAEETKPAEVSEPETDGCPEDQTQEPAEQTQTPKEAVAGEEVQSVQDEPQSLETESARAPVSVQEDPDSEKEPESKKENEKASVSQKDSSESKDQSAAESASCSGESSPQKPEEDDSALSRQS